MRIYTHGSQPDFIFSAMVPLISGLVTFLFRWETLTLVVNVGDNYFRAIEFAQANNLQSF